MHANIYGNGSTSIGREVRYDLLFDPSEEISINTVSYGPRIRSYLLASVFSRPSSYLKLTTTCSKRNHYSNKEEKEEGKEKEKEKVEQVQEHPVKIELVPYSSHAFEQTS
ncbi:hypothetical protein F0562_017188 [Nyssa sinensis]|uniref:Uncharacterized protein n=1 Tax=Nyssa sinensis TaxID=561372 RepID=A0A5J4ZGM6_9ASTE|nr:hypothetical protein F0562_017188 [Nyssa sinensis]